ncbi:hypothetical protein BDFB_010426 [Asbolus verrucosus]|uniref:FA desaturase domain containing protein n=1 Tax=Asbolus verrucosus TaxID=1661398 RepID=A0A482W7U2_ASBVE|nr:hypothetical protein BDFB_010426 [Asbolus verrucosus]
MFQDEIVWKKVFFFIYLHYGAAYGLYYFINNMIAWQTLLWTYFIILISTQGTGAGAHRLWAHRTYKAKLPLRILLTIYQTATLQKGIYDWCRDHRVHHKYSDTDCDPHNASRGFFYSHMGWLMLKKRDSVISKGRSLDLSDLEADPVVIAAHLWGNKPYNKNIKPTENLVVSYMTNGEGFHNYHHNFPWDYKAAELGSYYGNWSTAFIDFMAKIGWAHDLKTTSLKIIERRAQRVGDGSWRGAKESLWGWGDKDMDKDEMNMAEIRHSISARG